MGMFDEVTVNFSLPKGIVPGTAKVWQTKTFEYPFMEQYIITENGRLLKEKCHYEDKSNPKAKGIMRLFGMMSKVHDGWEDTNYHGILEIHTVYKDFYYSCTAKFTNGKCIKIKLNSKQKI